MAHAIDFNQPREHRILEVHSFDEIRGVLYSIGLSLLIVWLPVMWAIVHFSD